MVLDKAGEDQLDRSCEKLHCHAVKDETNIIHTINRMKGKWIGHVLSKNCLLQHMIEVKIEGRTELKGRRGRRYKRLMDDLKEKIGYC